MHGLVKPIISVYSVRGDSRAHLPIRKDCLTLMRNLHLTTMVLPLGIVFSTSGHADTYNYELGILYGASHTSTVSTVSFGPVLPAEPIRLESDTDTDDFSVFGTWYFDGVTSTDGPRSRAAFLGRASALSLSYMRSTGDTKSTLISSDPAIPSFMDRSDQSANSFSANLRYIWPESGWYGLASLSRADANFDSGSGSADISADAYSLGVGKYIGSQTTLDLSVVRLESEASGFVIGGNSASTEAAIAYSHIGSLGRTWQYGTDIVLATIDVGTSDGSYDVRLSLNPSRPVAFGIEVNGALQDPGDGRTTYELFASWFPRESIELAASYGWVSIDEPINTDFDQDNFGVGVNFRF